MRYENEDSTGAKVWLQDGMEVHEIEDKYRVRHTPDDRVGEEGWLPGTYPTVDEAFMAGKIAQQLKGG